MAKALSVLQARSPPRRALGGGGAMPHGGMPIAEAMPQGGMPIAEAMPASGIPIAELNADAAFEEAYQAYQASAVRSSPVASMPQSGIPNEGVLSGRRG